MSRNTFPVVSGIQIPLRVSLYVEPLLSKSNHEKSHSEVFHKIGFPESSKKSLKNALEGFHVFRKF